MASEGTTSTGTTRAHSAGDATFSTRTMRGADALSHRAFDRFAPVTGRSPGVSALSFSDRLMQPYFTSAREHRERVSVQNIGRRPVSEDVTWLFPVPWYSDELAFMLSEARRGSAPSTRPSDRRIAGSTERAPAPRSFSPLLPLAAVSAAELVADLLRPAATAVERSPIADAVGDLTMLSASAFAPPRSTSRPSTLAPAATSRPLSVRRPPVARAPSQVTAPAATPRASVDPTAPRRAVEERVRAAELLVEAARDNDLERTRFASAPPVELRPQLFDLDDAVVAIQQLEAPLVSYQRTRARQAAPADAPRTGVPSLAPVSWIPRAASRPAAARQTALSSVSEKPRALGHVAWADRWLARFAGASPATLGSLEPAIAVDPVAAFEAIFVTSLETPTPTRATARPDQPRPVTARPSLPSPAPTSTAPSASTPPSLPSTAPATAETRSSPVFDLDDDEPVSDEVFAAISEQIAQDRSPKGPWTDPAHRIPPGPRGQAPSALAQRALATPVAWASPGLRPGLGSSPAMPALAATLDAPIGPTFDVRSLALPPAVAAAMIASGRWPSHPGLVEDGRRAAIAPDVVYVEGVEIDHGAATGVVQRRATPASAPRATAPSANLAAASPATDTSAATPPAARRAVDIAAATSALVRRSPTPGAIGQLARSFGITRALASADLAYDFVPPEVISAARMYGFDADDAVRAMRLADGGEGPLAALKDAVAMTFIEAVSPSVTATRDPQMIRGPQMTRATPPAPRATPTTGDGPSSVGASMPAAPPQTWTLAPWSAPALSQAADALPLTDTRTHARSLVSPRRARGATLWPEAVLAHLGINRGQAERAQPTIGSALEVLAAGAVADAAVWVQAIEPGLDLDDVLAPATAAIRRANLAAVAPSRTAVSLDEPIEALDHPQLSLFGAADLDTSINALGAPDMIPLGAGTVAEPETPASPATPATPVSAGQPPTPFAAPLSSSPVSRGQAAGESAMQATAPVGSPGADAPWIRAAVSALPAAVRPAFESIYAVLAGDPQTRALPPAERAARALAVARRATGDQLMSARSRAAMAWSVLPTVIAGGSPSEVASAILGAHPLVGERDDRRRGGAGAPGVFTEPLTPIAAPPSPPSPPRSEYRAPTAAPTLVRTGPTAALVREAASAAAQGSRTAQAAMPTMNAIANSEGIPDWFLEAAKAITSDGQSSSSSSGISLAEMTLVTAAPSHSVAASARTASAPTRTQAGAGAGQGEQGEQGESPELEEMVYELAGMLRDYFETQRMRNGES